MSLEIAQLLDETEVAEMLKLKNPKTLAVWRSTKRYPELKWIKVGRLVRYRIEDVLSFIMIRSSDRIN